jgi:hypothetical protein
MDALATDYVKLVLNIGQYNPDYVDAYYGPDSLKPQPKANKPPSLPIPYKNKSLNYCPNWKAWMRTNCQ